MIVQLAVILLLVGGGYWYFKHSQGVILALTEDKAQLETAVSTQQATILAQQESAKRQNAANLALQQRMVDADRNRRLLESRLRQRNLEELARTNRADAEKQINEVTAQIFNELEELTMPRDRALSLTTSTQSGAATVRSDVQPPPRPPTQNGNGAPRP